MLIVFPPANLASFGGGHQKPASYEEAVTKLVSRFNEAQKDEIRKTPASIEKYHATSFVERHWLGERDPLRAQFEKDGVHSRALMALSVMRWAQMRIANESIDYSAEIARVKAKQDQLEQVLQHPPKE